MTITISIIFFILAAVAAGVAAFQTRSWVAVAIVLLALGHLVVREREVD